MFPRITPPNTGYLKKIRVFMAQFRTETSGKVARYIGGLYPTHGFWEGLRIASADNAARYWRSLPNARIRGGIPPRTRGQQRAILEALINSVDSGRNSALRPRIRTPDIGGLYKRDNAILLGIKGNLDTERRFPAAWAPNPVLSV